MRRLARLIAATALMSGAAAAYSAPTSYVFSGDGQVCTTIDSSTGPCSSVAITGTVAFEVIGGPDIASADGIVAFGRVGWVRSIFSIQWDGHVLAPSAPEEFVERYSADTAVRDLYPTYPWPDQIYNVQTLRNAADGSRWYVMLDRQSAAGDDWFTGVTFDPLLGLASGANKLTFIERTPCLTDVGRDCGFQGEASLTSMTRVVDAPEPSTLALMAVGLAGMGVLQRRRAPQ